MPSRKQRRRREKLQRHEYEYVVETDEGEEVVESYREIEPDDAPSQQTNGKRDRGKPAKRAPRAASAKGPVDRRGKPIPKPSLERSLKRALIFLPIFVIFLYLAAPSLTMIQKITQAVLLMLIFVPVTYFADKMVYRTAWKRWEQRGGSTRR